MGSQFSTSLFLDVAGTATEQFRTCGFRKNSSTLDTVRKIQDSARLNFFESFLVTLPSISSGTCDMYSRALSGSSVFCDWLFLVLSRVSLETAANFRLFLKVAMILREKVCQMQRLNWSFVFLTRVLISSYYEGKVSIKTERLMISIKGTIPKGYKF